VDDAARDESLVSHAGFFAGDFHVRNAREAEISANAKAAIARKEPLQLNR
jgi:hypothetical protein